MNKQPVSYLQTDSRWAKISYSAKGESTNIGASGCGPTSAAMLLATLTGKSITPKDTCAWSLDHGFKACNQGTYYTYFVPQFAAYGLTCKRLNTTNLYGNPNSDIHEQAIKLLKAGWYLIACMGKGNWTSSGHFVVVWWADGVFYINDPASQKTERLRGDAYTFRSQVKYYFAIDARAYNGQAEQEEKMTQDKFNEMMDTYLEQLAAQEPGDWSKEDREWAEKLGLVQGDDNGKKAYKTPLTKEQAVVLLHRFQDLK